MDKDTIALDGRIRASLAGRGSEAAAAALDARLAAGGAIASVRLGSGREAVLMAAIASRVVAEPGLKALVVAPSDRDVASLKAAFDALGASVGLACSTLGRDGSSEDAAATIGSIDAIASRAAAGTLDARSFGLVALSDLDALADAANAAMLRRAIGPASDDRRLVAFSSELGPAHRAIGRDLGGDVVELDLEAEGQRVKNAPSATYSVGADDKPRLLLGLLASGAARPVAVFCGPRDTAEGAARLLRSRGLRTEYVLGNLPRKRAVLDSVKAGDFEVLVLTDEGAEGLPGSWAGTLVNWDLPLEGERYLSRLEYLDASGPDARVYNFACDRYSVGLPAIERALGSRLAVVQPDPSLLAEDVEPRAERGSQPRQEAERAPDRRRADAPGRQGGNRDRGDRGDRGGQYDGRNARAIQADIAAITGGKPVAGGSGAAGRTAAAEPAKAGKKHGRKGRGLAPKPAAGGRPQASDQGRRGGEQGRKRDEQQPARPAPRKPRGGSGPRLSDPYAVSMEERLRVYRERYGASKGGAKESGKPAAAGPGQRRDSGERAREPGRGRPPAPRSAPASRPDAARQTPVAAPKGVLGALKRLFGKKDE